MRALTEYELFCWNRYFLYPRGVIGWAMHFEMNNVLGYSEGAD